MTNVIEKELKLKVIVLAVIGVVYHGVIDTCVLRYFLNEVGVLLHHLELKGLVVTYDFDDEFFGDAFGLMDFSGRFVDMYGYTVFRVFVMALCLEMLFIIAR